MLKFLASRVFQAVVTLLLVSVVVFAVGRATGSPVDLLLPLEAGPEQREALTRKLGLDKPLPEQYLIYLADVLQGDFGESLRIRQPVAEIVGSPLLNSLLLATTALVLTVAMGIPLGVFAARRHGGWADRAAMGVALVGQSVPAFLVGMVAITFLAVELRWFPTSGAGTVEQLVLPSFSLAAFSAASVSRLMRSSMLDVSDQEFVTLARSKGLSERVVAWKHIARNALIPVITFLGFQYGVLVTAAITTEVIFTYPGIGRLAYQAVLWRDYPLLQFIVLIFALIVVVLNLLADVAYAVADPRIRVS